MVTLIHKARGAAPEPARQGRLKGRVRAHGSLELCMGPAGPNRESQESLLFELTREVEACLQQIFKGMFSAIIAGPCKDGVRVYGTQDVFIVLTKIHSRKKAEYPGF
jgi:hypothetical protein